MANKPLYKVLAGLVRAYANCLERSREMDEWRRRHSDRINALVRGKMPSGSGCDNGTKIDLCASKPERLVFSVDFHHMDAHGFYAGWTSHEVIVTPSLQFGISLRITGRNRNEIKDYLHEIFDLSLRAEVQE